MNLIIGGAIGAVASRKSQVASGVAYGDLIGHWALGIGGRASALHAGLKSRLHSIGSVAKQRKPKPFTIHHSSCTIHHSKAKLSLPHSPEGSPRA